MKKLLSLVLGFFAISAFGQNFTGGFTAASPFNSSLRVSGTGGVTLSGPGTYSAPSWSFTGGLTLKNPGVYLVSGAVSGTGGIIGPSSGTATVRFVNGYNITNGVSANVTVLTGPAPVEPVPVDPTIPAPSGVAGSAPLVNISTRATLSAGQVLTPGFVVGGSVARRVLVRAIGPGLAAFGVPGAAAAPSLAVFNGSGAQIGANAGWGGSAGLAAVFAGVGAFALAPTSADAALLLTLAPGNYTARVSGSGEVLVEVYFVD